MKKAKIEWSYPLMLLIMKPIMVGSHLLLPATVTMVTKAAIPATTVGPLNLKVAAGTTLQLEGADILSPILPIVSSNEVDIAHIHIQLNQQITSEDSNSIVGDSTEDSNGTKSTLIIYNIKSYVIYVTN